MSQNLNLKRGAEIYNEAVRQLQAACAKRWPEGDPAALANAQIGKLTEVLERQVPLPLIPMAMMLGTALGAFADGNAEQRGRREFSESEVYEILDLMAFSFMTTVGNLAARRKPRIVPEG